MNDHNELQFRARRLASAVSHLAAAHASLDEIGVNAPDVDSAFVALTTQFATEARRAGWTDREIAETIDG